MARKRIALVTSEQHPQLTADDRLLAEAMSGQGVDAAPAVWTDPLVRWDGFDAALLRSTWDYHLHAEEFAAWVERVAGQTRLLNPPDLVRWNMDKTYLAELAGRGVPVVPTIVVEPAARFPSQMVAERGWTDVVLKPRIGASAWQAVKAQVHDAEKVVTPELRQRGYLAQPFVPQIQQGELSLIFFGGRYSHALLKTPAGADFRSQYEVGGTIEAAAPVPELIAAAAAILALLPVVPVYARVDGILLDGRFTLMELELIEPELYFRLAPGAAERFAQRLRDA